MNTHNFLTSNTCLRAMLDVVDEEVKESQLFMEGSSFKESVSGMDLEEELGTHSPIN